MRTGVIVLPDRPWPDARRDWELAESLGCDHAWTFDHLTMGAYSTARWHAAMPTLAATGPRAMHVAARLGAAWVTNCAEDQLEQQARLFDAIDPGRTLDRMLEVGTGWRDRLDSADAFAELAARAAAVGYTDLVVPFRGGDAPLRGWLGRR